MNGGRILDKVCIDLADLDHQDIVTVEIDVFDNGLARKWLGALNHVLDNHYVLEKNYCFLGFVDTARDGWFILDQINRSIKAINQADLGYTIDDHFSMEDCMTDCVSDDRAWGVDVGKRNIVHERFNRLHRYFEDLQGVSGQTAIYYDRADAETRWYIRQLNLLCHEFESWALSYRKQIEAPEWQRPSQLMCWLDSPRFELEPADYELFGIDTINRSFGGVYVGVNKAVGKHHWEVFNDEGKDSRIGELVSSTMRSQTQASADFDIEWGISPAGRPWQIKRLEDFRKWLQINGFDPEDKSLTIGHPQIGQVNLQRSFGTDNSQSIWMYLNTHLDVMSVRTSQSHADYPYHWNDHDFQDRQIKEIVKGTHHEMD